MKTTNEKVKELLNALKQKNASYWKIGTDPLQTFKRLYEILNNEMIIDHEVNCALKEGCKTTQGKNPGYVFRMGENEFCPATKNYVAINTMGQYIRIFRAFGLIIIELEVKNITNFIEEANSFKFVCNVKEKIMENNWTKLIINVIVNGCFSNVDDINKIAYSILFEQLFINNFDFSTLPCNLQHFYWSKIIGKTNKKTIKTADLIDQLSKIKNDIYTQGTKATYKTINKVIKQNWTFEQFIDQVYKLYIDKLENKNENDKLNYNSIITTIRSKFKENIFNDRKQKGLIQNKNDLYSDVISAEDNTKIGLEAKFNDANACHIYEVNQIKKEIDWNNPHQLEFIANPNNGLMMKIEYHQTFDKGLWTFDINGNMLVNYEDQKYLFNDLGLKKIKIDPKVFNEKMREFLMKR